MKGGLLLSVVILSGCAHDGSSWEWTATLALDARTKLGGCAIGDVHAAKGNEIVAVSVEGKIFVAWRESGEWKSEVVADLPGEMIQCAVADVTPAHPGNEIVAVGMKKGGEDDGGPGAAWLIHRDTSGWKSRLLFEDLALIHGVCVTDEGVLVVGYSRRATLIRAAATGWKVEALAQLPGAGKHAVPYSGGIAIPCNDGTLIRLFKEEGSWKTEALATARTGQARAGSDGTRLVVARDDGALVLVTKEATTVIYSEPSKLRGAALGDFDPGTPGLEAATAGYEKRISVLYAAASGWKAVTVATDTGRFHHMVAGELDSTAPGLELAACGYSGRVTVVARVRRK